MRLILAVYRFARSVVLGYLGHRDHRKAAFYAGRSVKRYVAAGLYPQPMGAVVRLVAQRPRR